MKTDISLVKLRGFSKELNMCAQKIRKERLELTEVRSVLRRIEDEAIGIVASNLEKQIERLAQEEINLRKLRVCLDRIISLYEQCEEKILDYGETDGWIARAVLLNINRYTKVLKEIPNINFVYGSE